MLNKQTIIAALKRLGQLAHSRGLHLQVCIYGGSAMMLAYDNRETTRDVDALIHPAEEGLALARQVAKEMDLHADWLNDEVRFYVSNHDADGRRDFPFECEGIAVQMPTANYLLALKAMACREPVPGMNADRGDLAFLIKKMEIRSTKAVEEQVERFFPDDGLRPRARRMIEDLIREEWNANETS